MDDKKATQEALSKNYYDTVGSQYAEENNLISNCLLPVLSSVALLIDAECQVCNVRLEMHFNMTETFISNRRALQTITVRESRSRDFTLFNQSN